MNQTLDRRIRHRDRSPAEQPRNFNLLEYVKRIRGAEAALGLTFATKDRMDARLPEGSRLLGYSHQTYFCFIEGYQETVFAVDDQPEGKWQAWPVAYSFAEFLRLILACGSAELSARIVKLSEEAYGRELDRQLRTPKPDLLKLQQILDLTPIPDPYGYARTVERLIDCEKIVRM